VNQSIFIFKKGTREMNANELADELDTTGRLHNWAKKAQAMLRQQQDEITVLKQILSYEGIEVNLNECVEEFRKAQK
jgi:hypothetical protein